MKKKILIIFLIPLFSFSVLHKFYMSLTDIEFNQKEESVQMVMNVFIDDIQKALDKEFKINSQLTSSNEIANIDTYFKTYLQDHFKVNINGKPQNYKFVGKEYDGEIVYFYLEIENISKLNTIKFENSILLKYFSKQQNLIKVKKGTTRKSLFLNKNEQQGVLKF